MEECEAVLCAAATFAGLTAGCDASKKPWSSDDDDDDDFCANCERVMALGFEAADAVEAAVDADDG